jgi:hypothetical protein
MAITSRYVLMCDEVRQEITGKLILLGLYTPDIGVAQVPVLLPSLTFVCGLESDRPGNFPIRFGLQHLDSGQEVLQGMGAAGFQRPGFAPAILPMRNLTLGQVGTYVFSLTIDAQRDPITSSFNVTIAQMPQPRGGPGQGFPLPGFSR